MLYQPIEPIAELPRWSETLTAMAQRPLELCPDFPRIARRFEAWWNHEVLDRPIFIGEANGNPKRPITRRLELLDKPEQWMGAKRQDMAQTHLVGDALPSIRVDFGAVMLGALFGGKARFESDTTWTDAFINDDWTNEPDWHLHEDHPWWGLLKKLTTMVAEEACGKYLLRTPDLGGSADVLLNLRGSSELCMDVLERPDRVKSAIDAMYSGWRKVFHELFRITLGAGAGIVHWLGLWSNRPHVVPACDFNYLIGPAEFQRLCLPDIARQAATVGRACFHLDGPGAARHIDALLEIPEIQAIQFTPGEGAPSALQWVAMLRKIQSKGRSVLIITPASEVLELCRHLRPEGLALWVPGGATPAQLDEIFQNLRQC